MHSRLAMELEQRLLLDEERLDQLPTARRTVFVLRWLLELDQRLDRLQSVSSVIPGSKSALKSR